MKILILLTALTHTAWSTCPAVCNCTESAVLCVEQSLTQVPSFKYLDNTPAIMDLSGNNFMYLESPLVFPKSSDVKELFLNSSQLAYIEPTVFEHLNNLQEIYLGDNILGELPEMIIATLEDIILLELSQNHFTKGMPVIRSESLEVLSLANSKISVISENALKFLPNLKLLLLQQNDLKKVSMEVFQNVPIQSLFLKLSYNPWSCDCNNMEVFQMLLNNNFVDLTDPYHCNDGDNVIDIYGKSGQIYMNRYCLKDFGMDNGINIIDEYSRTLIKEKEEIDTRILSSVQTENPKSDVTNWKETDVKCASGSFWHFVLSIAISLIVGFLSAFICMCVVICKSGPSGSPRISYDLDWI